MRYKRRTFYNVKSSINGRLCYTQFAQWLQIVVKNNILVFGASSVTLSSLAAIAVYVWFRTLTTNPPSVMPELASILLITVDAPKQ